MILLHSFCHATKFPLSRVIPFSLWHSGAAEVFWYRARYQPSQPPPFGASVIRVQENVYVTSPLPDLRLLNPINCVYHPVLAA